MPTQRMAKPYAARQDGAETAPIVRRARDGRDEMQRGLLRGLLLCAVSSLLAPMLCVGARRWTVLRPRPRDAAEVACRQRK